MILHLRDASRHQLSDSVDVEVLRWPSRQRVMRMSLTPVSGPVHFPALDDPLSLYQVQAWPLRHRPVWAFAYGGDERTLYCPVDPARVQSIKVDWANQDLPAMRPTGLSDLELAGMLNIWTKLRVTTVADGRPVSDFVTRVDRVRGDRIYADVAPTLVDVLASSDDFTAAPDHLHEPPDGYVLAGSYKHTGFGVGVLQVTLFKSEASPVLWMADIDIDDAGGIGHVFQVLGHWFTGGQTHPYDIHQILTFHQRLNPGYALVV